MQRAKHNREHNISEWWPGNAALWTWADVFDWFALKRPPQSTHAWCARTALDMLTKVLAPRAEKQ